jgi:hypothetical protein
MPSRQVVVSSPFRQLWLVIARCDLECCTRSSDLVAEATRCTRIKHVLTKSIRIILKHTADTSKLDK